MTMQAGGKWIGCEERNPEQYGKYRVLCVKRGQRTEDEYLWNNAYWVTPRGCPSKGVQAWWENPEAPADNPEKTQNELQAGATGRVLTLADYEARIHLYKEQIGTGYIGIGRTLNEAKAAGVVPHGQWEAWVTRTTGLNPRQAQRCMQAATEIREGSALAQLEMSKALLLLSSGLEDETREEVAEKAAGNGATVRELKAEIARIREAKEREDAENAETVKALKLQIVQESGTAAEIREALKRARGERDALEQQMRARENAWKTRMDEEAGKAYQRGSDDGAREAERNNASLRDALQHSREDADQLREDLKKAKDEAEHGYDDGYNVAKGEMAGRIREANERADRLLEQRDSLMQQLRARDEKPDLRYQEEAVRQAVAAKEDEIAELQAELEAAEAREAKRAQELAALRKEKAQAGMDAARGIGAQAVGAMDLTAAVRDFIGRAGVLPQMGNLIAGMSAEEREQIRVQVETVAEWVRSARTAMGTVVADATIR